MKELYNALPDDRPINAVCVVEDVSKCPAGFTVVANSYDQDFSPGAQAAVITVHVLDGKHRPTLVATRIPLTDEQFSPVASLATGEHPAAMQRGNRSPGGINSAINSPFYLHSYLSVCIVQIMTIHQLLGWILTAPGLI